MGFLGDLFATKGQVEARVTVTGIPSGVTSRFKIAFVPMNAKGAKPPRSIGDDPRWTRLTEEYRVERSLPVGHWQMMVVVSPLMPESSRKQKKDSSREIPFWPLAAAFEVRKGETAIVTVTVAFPKAGFSD